MDESMNQVRQRRPWYRLRRPWQVAGGLLVVAAVVVIGSNSFSVFASGVVHGPVATTTTPSNGPVYQAAPPVAVCGNNGILGGGPVTSPVGAVRVPAGDDTAVDFAEPDTVYWFAPGTHTLGSSSYTQIIAGAGSKYIGAPGAILDGRHTNFYAFGGSAADVQISYLTIENFGVHGGNMNQG